MYAGQTATVIGWGSLRESEFRQGGEHLIIFTIKNQPGVLSVFRWSTTSGFAKSQRTSVDKSGMQV